MTRGFYYSGGYGFEASFPQLAYKKDTSMIKQSAELTLIDLAHKSVIDYQHASGRVAPNKQANALRVLITTAAIALAKIEGAKKMQDYLIDTVLRIREDEAKGLID